MSRIYLDKRVDASEKSPCRNCETGYGSYASGQDEKGEYIEVEHCQDTCNRYKEWLRKLPHL